MVNKDIFLEEGVLKKLLINKEGDLMLDTTKEFQYWENKVWMSDDHFNQLGSILKAMAHPLRLKILHTLYQKEACVSEIFVEIGTTQSNASWHLCILKDKGMLTSTRMGVRVFYRITCPGILKVMRDQGIKEKA